MIYPPSTETSTDPSSAPAAPRPPQPPREGGEQDWNPSSLPSFSGWGDLSEWPAFESLPDWFHGFRDPQAQAIIEIVDAFKRGARVVFLDGPTGSGKTLVGEAVRKIVSGRALYVCNSKALQDQFVADYPYARVLKGRANYPTVAGGDTTAADCVGEGCHLCPENKGCPYLVAKGSAQRAPLAVLNTSYFLAATNHTRTFNDRRLVIIDEADTLEQQLMSHEEFRLTTTAARQLGLHIPGKGVHRGTIAKWLTNDVCAALNKRRNGLLDAIPEERLERRKLKSQIERTRTVADHYQQDEWVRCYDHTGSLILKPVTVADLGPDRIWDHGELFLLMSATLISTQELVDSLGIHDRHETVTMPMTFPVEHRPIYTVPVAKVTAKEKDTAYPQLADAIEKILDRHPGDRVLVHTVSYELAGYLHRNVHTDRQKLTYQTSREKDTVLSEFRKRMAAVLFAPSLDRGYDFSDDDARVVIVAKLPYPYLGDQQVSARMNTPTGQYWYTVQTIRSLVQMTGRGVRSAEDWAHTYIIDAGVMQQIRRNKHLFPRWWMDAVRTDLVPRNL